VKTTVRWHESTHDDLEVWVEDQPGRDPDRRLLTQNSLDELVRLLQATGGVPDNAIRIEGIEPPSYWWMYYDDLWLQYTVREEPRKWWNPFGRPVRRVTILRASRHRPERFVL
jgi:hypothetical protein